MSERQRGIPEDPAGMRVTVVGLARSGVGAANLLADLGARVTVTDRKSAEDLKDFLHMLRPEVGTVLGGHPPALFESADLVVASPGVASDSGPLKAASNAGVKIIGELELAYRVVKRHASAAGARTEFLAITGTNGKSTTTSLLYEIVKTSGLAALLGGNIGNALTGELDATGLKKPVDYIVTEVSSFQLEHIEDFRPRGAALLNITPDHLDRYASVDDYAAAKCNMFLNQGESDFLVLNGDDPFLVASVEQRLHERSRRPQVFFFSRLRPADASCRDGVISFRIPPEKAGHVGLPERAIEADIPVASLRIKGVHNIENAMAAGLVGLLAGCPIDAVTNTFREFPGLEHRLEFVRNVGGVAFINDSKGTNVGAVIKSIESFTEPIVLIAGGRDKHGDFSVLAPLVKERVKAVVLIGEATETMRKALAGVTPVFAENSFEAAIRKARDLASPGDVVLLSPACASFDMFRDFEDRGRQFKKIVEGL
jgi:UDP-N-acetylmuramoylalanine--D-glutamate ligase